MTTSYSNPCGSGDRRSLMTVTGNPTGQIVGTLSNLINGNNSDIGIYFSGGTVAVNIVFDFNIPKKIDEITFIQSNAVTHGTWSWQGSSDNTQWIDIQTDIVLGGYTSQVISISNSSKGYRYYKLLLVSGTVSSIPYLYEFNFKIDNYALYKYLIRQETDIYAIKPNFYSKIGQSPVTESMFLNSGADDLTLLNTSQTMNTILGTSFITIGTGKVSSIQFNSDFSSINTLNII